jgi:lipopolysaccharide export system protein LptA
MWFQHLISMIFEFKNYCNILLLLVTISISLFSNVASAEYKKFSDSNITITSDFLNLDKNNLSATFKGSVTVIFEDIIVKTNYLIIYYTNNNNKRSIEKIKIPGKLKAIKKLTKEVIVADSGEYLALSNQLILMGNVNMQKDKHIIVTDKLIYSTRFNFAPKKNHDR